MTINKKSRTLSAAALVAICLTFSAAPSQAFFFDHDEKTVAEQGIGVLERAVNWVSNTLARFGLFGEEGAAHDVDG